MSTTSLSPRPDEPIPIALANTIWSDRTGVHDAFVDLNDAATWLRAAGARLSLTPAFGREEVITAESARRLVELRDAIRRLAAEHTRDPRQLGQSPITDARAATSMINTASALSSMWPELREGDDTFTLTRRDAWAGESSADAAISAIARETIDLVTSPQWQQLRPCTAPGCAYYFVKEHFRQRWCSAVCGNRARVARHAAQSHDET
jgi:predicted RNA-binding Zn ribbon-like protein